MKLAVLAMMFVPLTAGASALPTVQMVTFEAPPFMGANLPEQGAAVYAMKQTFLKAGYDLKVSFAPLKRAKFLALESADIAGYFPVSPYELDKQFWSSKVIFSARWVIAERKDKPIRWQKLTDLKPYVGSVSVQYRQPPELVKLIQEKTLTVEQAPDDTSNLIKLGNKRVDYILIDPTVFEYITKTDPKMKAFAKDLQINERPIEMLKYTVAFKKGVTGKKLLDAFNDAITLEEFTKLIQEQLKK